MLPHLRQSSFGAILRRRTPRLTSSYIFGRPVRCRITYWYSGRKAGKFPRFARLFSACFQPPWVTFGLVLTLRRAFIKVSAAQLAARPAGVPSDPELFPTGGSMQEFDP